MSRTLLPLTLACAVLAACASSTKDQTPPARTSLATATAGDLTIELLADAPLATGLTPVWLSVRTSAGAAVTDAAVTFAPVMTMTSGTVHSAPVLAPPAAGADGLYRCDVVFQMASGAMGSWSADVSVAPTGAATVETTFPSLTVSDSGRAKTFSFADAGVTTKYVASLNLDAPAAVGLNPVTVTLHRMVDMMTFAPVDDATLALDPQMPSMGHGAPGSVAPALASPGVYEGELAFSMAGTWETTLTVTRGGVVVGAPVFTTAF